MVFAILEGVVMKSFGWMGVGVGLFLGAVGLAVVTDLARPVVVPEPVEWATALPEGALSKVPANIPIQKHEAAVGKVRRVVVFMQSILSFLARPVMAWRMLTSGSRIAFPGCHARWFA